MSAARTAKPSTVDRAKPGQRGGGGDRRGRDPAQRVAPAATVSTGVRRAGRNPASACADGRVGEELPAGTAAGPGRRGCGRAAAPPRCEAQHADHRAQRHLAETADRGPAQGQLQLEHPGLAGPRPGPPPRPSASVEQGVRLGGPDPARHALAARLVAEEPQHVRRGREQVGALGHHHQRAGAEHRAGLGQRVEVEPHVEVVGAEEVRRRAAGLHGGRAAAPPATPPARSSRSRDGGAHRHAVDAGPLDVPGDGEELQPDASRPSPWSCHHCAPRLDDDRHVGERLDRVHQRGPAPQAVDAGERRLVARLAAVPLHALDQRRLLAEDVAARRGEHLDRRAAARVPSTSSPSSPCSRSARSRRAAPPPPGRTRAG